MENVEDTQTGINHEVYLFFLSIKDFQLLHLTLPMDVINCLIKFLLVFKLKKKKKNTLNTKEKHIKK